MGDFAALVALVARVGLVVTAVVLRESESSSLATAAFSFFRALLLDCGCGCGLFGGFCRRSEGSIGLCKQLTAPSFLRACIEAVLGPLASCWGRAVAAGTTSMSSSDDQPDIVV